MVFAFRGVGADGAADRGEAVGGAQRRVRSGMPEGVVPGVLNGQSGVCFKDLVDIPIIVTFVVWWQLGD